MFLSTCLEVLKVLFRKGEVAGHERASQDFENTFKKVPSTAKMHLL